MLQSKLSNFVRKEFPKDEEAHNARLLIRAGFIDKVMAGVYSYLPFGLRVLSKINSIVREEINKLGAQEVLMPALTPKENWQQTGRWENFDALFKVISRDKKEFALGATHEEIVVPLSQKAIFSYKDMPCGFYQIQNKFRDEPRAKSGMLRGREFVMKDLYSFHADSEDLDLYYKKAIKAYSNIFKRLGLNAWLVEASGGTFSKYSHEFQVFSPNGEDSVVYCKKCQFAQNSEINSSKSGDSCPKCKGLLEISSAIEVGNIFKLNTKYSDPFSLKFRDKDGLEKIVIMGCYGIGTSRLMGVAAELFNDEKGLIWPESIAPFQFHLVALGGGDEKESKKVYQRANKIYDQLLKLGIEVLYDDREDKTPGEKFAESDLIGIPVRLVVSARNGTKIEFKKRNMAKASLVDFSFIKKYCISQRD
ncbi:MAG TPA: His/Gly/Thr/Pro-type tRNA ligase C-terminal domain-containing protein [Candidatus Paceibacterota bacterium]|nr:His/Gly/Thr/Pro-type tRNA ligase C-terminal domain-containing protein [Candidatus Paceibacterota bacterium]